MLRDYLTSLAVVLLIVDLIIADNLLCSSRDLYKPFKNDHDRESYFVCVSKLDKAIKVDCPDGFAFNVERRSCTWAKMVENQEKICIVVGQLVDHPDNTPTSCKKVQKCDAALNPIDVIECSGDTSFNPLFGECLNTTVWHACDQDKKPDCQRYNIYDNEKLPIWDDDTAYYTCENQIRLKKKCSSSTNFFDPKKRACTKRPTALSSNPIQLPDIKTICNGNAMKYIPDPIYCKGYYYCLDDETPYWDYCDQSPYLYFDNGYCVRTRPNTCTCEDLEYLDDLQKIYVKHSDKSKYNICEKDKLPVTMSCPRGYVYDESDESCAQM